VECLAGTERLPALSHFQGVVESADGVPHILACEDALMNKSLPSLEDLLIKSIDRKG
jgi:hypothetical protein